MQRVAAKQGSPWEVARATRAVPNMTRRSTGAQRLSQVQGSHTRLLKQHSSDLDAAGCCATNAVHCRGPDAQRVSTAEQQLASACCLHLLVSCTASNQIPQVAARPLRPQRRRLRGLRPRMQNQLIAKACKTEPSQRRPKGCPTAVEARRARHGSTRPPRGHLQQKQRSLRRRRVPRATHQGSPLERCRASTTACRASTD